jgi:hypothetical protein
VSGAYENWDAYWQGYDVTLPTQQELDKEAVVGGILPQSEPVKGKAWNVQIPVVKVIDAETAVEAIEIFRGQITVAGFEVYEGMAEIGEPAADAFLSDVNEAGEEVP